MSSLLTNLKVNSDGYLYIPYSEDFNFGSGDFTIEFWVKFNSWSDAKSILTKGWPASGADSFLIYTQDGSKVTFYASSNGSGWQISSAQNIINNVSLNKWYHIAVTRSGSTFRTFSNGVQTASWNNGDAIFNNTSHGIAIGNSENGNHPVDCNIDGLRITKGVCRYSSNFSPPVDDGSLATTGAFKDRSRSTKRVFNNNYVGTNQNDKQFGDSSAYFNGSSYLSVPGDKAWQLGTDDFTVEAWINPDTVTNTRSVVGNYDGSDGGWRLAVGSPIGGTPIYGPEVTFTATNGGSEVDVIIPGVLEITRNNQTGIYNSAVEGSYGDQSPANTVWNRCREYQSGPCCVEDANNWNNICDYTNRTYGTWRIYGGLRYCYGSGAFNYLTGKELIMKHVPTNRYWAIKFTSWQTGAQGGAFSYTRKEILGCTVDTSVMQFRNGNNTVIQTSIAPPLASGVWKHIAASRASGVTKLFIDGDEIGVSNDTYNINRVNLNGLTVGASRSSGGSVTDAYQGYIDDLRITKGTARYSASFTKPAAPLTNLGPAPTSPGSPSGLTVTERNDIFKVSLTPPTFDGRSPITAYNIQYSEDSGSSWTDKTVVSDPYYDKVSLLLPLTGSNNSTNIVDDSKHNHNIGLMGNVQITSSESWFGNGSVVFDGTNDNLVINNNSVFDLTNQDWTIEAWIRPTGNWSKYNNIITKRGNGGSEGTECDFQLYLGINSGVLGFYNESVGVKESSITPLANIWNHVAAVRNGSTITLYLNGISVLSFVANALYNTNRKVYVGGWPAANNGSDYFYGNMNDVRVTKGVARYTSNFDPRTLPQDPANRVTGLSTLGSPYIFRARAVNAIGSSSYSTSTTSIISTLGVPSDLNIIPDTDRAYLSWTAPTPNNSAIRDYSIQYSSNGGSTWTDYAHTPSIDTSIVVSGLADSTNYLFQVAAINIAGTGNYVTSGSSVLTALRQDNTYNKTRLILHLDSN